MSKVKCDQISEGLRSSEAVASVRDHVGRMHFIRVERDFLSQRNGSQYLPIGVVHVDPRTGLVLIELPQESETGANRLWVRKEQLDDPVEALA